MSAFGGKADIRGVLTECLLLTADTRLTEGYCRQRMAERRKENKKIARLAEVVFLRFQFQLSGVPGVYMPVFPIAEPISLLFFQCGLPGGTGPNAKGAIAPA